MATYHCSKKAFSRCPYKRFCGSAGEAEFAEGSECAEFNRAVENQPITRGDRIRSMSNRELAEFLVSFRNADHIPDGAINTMIWLSEAGKEEANEA